MTLDYSKPGNVQIKMLDYVEYMAKGPVEELVRNRSWIEPEGAPRSRVLKNRGDVTGTVCPLFGHLMSEAGRTDR